MNNKTIKLVFREDFLDKIRSYFYESSNDNNERLAVVFLSTSMTKKNLGFLSTEIMLPQKEDYVLQTSVGVKVSDDFVNRYYKKCSKYNYSLMLLHSHPFDKSDECFFSTIDDTTDAEQYSFLSFINPKAYFISAVMNKGGAINLRMIQKTGFTALDNVVINSIPFKKKIIQGQESNQNNIYDRQIMAFGEHGQRLMQSMHACIVGVGGIGSIMCEILTRLGVRDFTLIDFDRAESTNHNRLAGMTFRDIDTKPFKVSIGRRTIKQINPSANVKCVRDEVYSKKAIEAMKNSDIVFLCTDNATSRDFVNKFCIQYLTPCISMGTAINADKISKKVLSILGEVITIIPGSLHETFCLRCAGAIDTDALKIENAPGNLKDRIAGYVRGAEEPAPAVRYINGIVADLGAAEFHNLLCGFKEPSKFIRINLVPKRLFIDDFIIEDFEKFLKYLKDNGIIIDNIETARNLLINNFTTVRSDGKRKVRKEIMGKEFIDVADYLTSCKLIDTKKYTEFIEEISCYFKIDMIAEEKIIEAIDINNVNKECFICSDESFIIGQGDNIELKKISY